MNDMYNKDKDCVLQQNILFFLSKQKSDCLRTQHTVLRLYRYSNRYSNFE